MTFKQAFLPVGLILAVLGALLLPKMGIAMQEIDLIPVMVMIIFLVNGWGFKMADAQINRSFILALFACTLLSLVLGPVIGLFIARIFNCDPLMQTGLIVMASVPVTLSSAIVMAEICGGNRTWALLMTIGMNLVGIFTLPFMLKLTLETTGEIEISAITLLIKLVQLVLLPFLFGYGLRHTLGRWLRPGAWLSYVPSICVILTVYVGFAASRELLLDIPYSAYPALSGAALSIHMILMALAFCIAKRLRLGLPERYTILFIGSQKTLPVAITVMTIIAPTNAIAMVPCLLFHFIQLFIDSFIASHLHKSKDSST